MSTESLEYKTAENQRDQRAKVINALVERYCKNHLNGVNGRIQEAIVKRFAVTRHESVEEARRKLDIVADAYAKTGTMPFRAI